MYRTSYAIGIGVALILMAVACEAPETNGASQGGEEAAVASEDGPSDIDHGGIDTIPTDPALVEKGEGLFRSEGCIGCHQMDAAGAGPALGDVTERRSPAWIARMIMSPEEMTDRDPQAQQVAENFVAPMPATNLSPEKARAIIAYLGAQ